MKFFIPHANGDEQAERVWEGIAKHLADVSGRPIGHKRLQYISYQHDARSYSVAVGDTHPLNKEEVIAILVAGDDSLYYVTTPSRGVVSGEPIYVGKSDVDNIKEFD